MKRINKTKILTFILFSMIFLTLIVQNNINFLNENDTILAEEIQEIQDKGDTNEVKRSSVYTDLITINASADGVSVHNWTSAQDAGLVEAGGDGTQGNPYIIENLEIDGQNSHGGIEILDSNGPPDIYFRIENNLIYNVGAANSRSAGIKLYRTQHGTIRNNNISSRKAGNYGIHIKGQLMMGGWPWDPDTSKDINVTENTITNTERGIYIEDGAQEITVSENIAKYNTLAGIYIARRCIRLTVTNNILSENDVFGIADTDSNNHMMPEMEPMMDENTIQNNIITNNAYGLYLAQTKGSIISYNNISSNFINGMYISGSSWNYIANNTIADNTDKGILMVMGPSGSFRNRIYGNDFLRNGAHAEELTSSPPFYVMGGWENNWSWWGGRKTVYQLLT